MKKYFKNIREDRLIFKVFIITFVLIVITLIYILLNYGKLPPLLPVFNQLPWGEQRLSATPGVFIPSIIVSIIFFMNVIASAFIYSSSPLISRMLSITSFLTALLAFLFIIRTVQLIS